MVATGVRRVRCRVSVRVSQNDERVQLAHNAHGWTRLASIQHAFDARDGDANLIRDTKLLQFLGDELRRMVLTEARLWVMQNSLSDPHDVLTAPVDLSLHLGFEFLCGWHGNSCGCKLVRLVGRL